MSRGTERPLAVVWSRRDVRGGAAPDAGFRCSFESGFGVPAGRRVSWTQMVAEMFDQIKNDRFLDDLESPDELRRRNAIFAMVKASEIRAIPSLKHISSFDESMELRFLARKALRFMARSSPAAAREVAPVSAGVSVALSRDNPSLIGIRLAARDPGMRASALKAAGSNGDISLLPKVLARIGVEDHSEVRSLLVLVIGILGGAAHLREVADFLRDDDPRVRSNAVEALEKMRHPSAYAIIIRALQDPDHRVKTTCLKVLGNLGKINLVRCCEAMMSSQEYWMRDSAAYCLAVAAVPEGIPILEGALEDEYESVKIKAKQGLSRMAENGHQAAQKALEKAGDIKDEESLEDFLKLECMTDKHRIEDIDSSDLTQRRRATRQLVAMTADTREVPELLQRLRDESDPEVRAGLLRALGRYNVSHVLTALKAYLSDPSDVIRSAVVDALGNLDLPEAISLVIPRLEDESPRVRVSAIMALSRIKDQDVEPYVKAMVEHTSSEHREAAIFLIVELGQPGLHVYLEKLCTDEDLEISSKAAETLNFTGFDDLSAETVPTPIPLASPTSDPADERAGPTTSPVEPDKSVGSQGLGIPARLAATPKATPAQRRGSGTPGDHAQENLAGAAGEVAGAPIESESRDASSAPRSQPSRPFSAGIPSFSSDPIRVERRSPGGSGLAKKSALVLAGIGLLFAFVRHGVNSWRQGRPAYSIAQLRVALNGQNLVEIERYLSIEKFVGAALAAVMDPDQARLGMEDIASRAGIDVTQPEPVQRTAAELRKSLGSPAESGKNVDPEALDFSLQWLIGRLRTAKGEIIQDISYTDEGSVAIIRIPYDHDHASFLLRIQLISRDGIWQVSGVENYGALIQKVMSSGP